MNVARLLLRYRVVRPKLVQDAPLALTEIHSRGTGTLKRPVVLKSLDEMFQMTPSTSFSGRQLWNSTKLIRENRNVRRSHGACVVGSAAAVKRAWREYKIRPNVVYVPDTEPTVASWCLEEDLPTCVVRCSPAEINRRLLSAELCDGYAAEFPTPTAPLLEMFLGEGKPTRLASMLVLVGLRIPSNVGVLIRGAVDMGFESVLLIDCVDLFSEKVLRASGGTAFSPRIKVFEASGDAVSLLSNVATEHHLLPLLAVPSQMAEPAFEVAKRFHASNAMRRAQSNSREAPLHVGPLLVLGSEAQGLSALTGGWTIPHQYVSVPLPNSTIDSVNVGVAGSVLMHGFRPAAEKKFVELGEVQQAGEREGVAFPTVTPLVSVPQ